MKSSIRETKGDARPIQPLMSKLMTSDKLLARGLAENSQNASLLRQHAALIIPTLVLESPHDSLIGETL
jgi:hypothetical protein